jgi:protein-S-isoprenylcysteine O-methyltransferase Ste14
MRKLFLSIISNALMIILPLAGRPALMLHYKIIFIVAGSIAMWFTQPAFTVAETADQKQSDKFSVLLILFMSLISVVVPVIDWAYFHSNRDEVSNWTFVGAAIIIAGIVFRAWSVRTLGRFFTPTVQIKAGHVLVTCGPYSIVRHPSYLGAFLSITGGAVLLESLIGFIAGCLAMFTAYYVRISVEEKELTLHFGDKYRTYKSSTKRIIPFVW